MKRALMAPVLISAFHYLEIVRDLDCLAEQVLAEQYFSAKASLPSKMAAHAELVILV